MRRRNQVASQVAALESKLHDAQRELKHVISAVEAADLKVESLMRRKGEAPEGTDIMEALPAPSEPLRFRKDDQ